jgi:valyl-tRNA synthetase
MSKSLGNTMAPQKISDTLGADILRLWVASTDYTGELSIGEEILKRVTESYRRIRNTLRFLLANTSDFDPAQHAVPVAGTARDRPLRAGLDGAPAEGHPRTSSATSSTRWSRACRTTARKTWAASTSTS